MTTADGSGPAAADLAAAAERLEIAARRQAASCLVGDYRTAVLGSGLVFSENRKYVPGEPARRIDWNLTARLGEPYVKLFEEERLREVVVLLDVSPSMHAGFQAATKLEHAVLLAASLAVSAIDEGDRIGLVVFADRVLADLPSRGGRAQLHRALTTLLRHTEPWERPVDVSNPRVAIHALERRRGRRAVVFLISDFLDHDVPDDITYLGARHDVSLVHVYDPAEHAAPSAAVRFPAHSPEGRANTDTVTPGRGEPLSGVLRTLRDAGSAHRISVHSVATTEPVGAALRKIFHSKRRARR